MTDSVKPVLSLPRDPGTALNAAYQFGEGLLEVLTDLSSGDIFKYRDLGARAARLRTAGA